MFFSNFRILLILTEFSFMQRCLATNRVNFLDEDSKTSFDSALAFVLPSSEIIKSSVKSNRYFPHKRHRQCKILSFGIIISNIRYLI